MRLQIRWQDFTCWWWPLVHVTRGMRKNVAYFIVIHRLGLYLARWCLDAKNKKLESLFLVCCNTEGFEKIPLMTIGSALNPPAFKNKSDQKLGFDYNANKKAWMIFLLYFSWPQLRDQFIDIQEERKFLLLIENFNAHGTADSLLPPRNVWVQFLPPNTSRV